MTEAADADDSARGTAAVEETLAAADEKATSSTSGLAPAADAAESSTAAEEFLNSSEPAPAAVEPISLSDAQPLIDSASKTAGEDVAADAGASTESRAVVVDAVHPDAPEAAASTAEAAPTTDSSTVASDAPAPSADDPSSTPATTPAPTPIERASSNASPAPAKKFTSSLSASKKFLDK